MSTDSFAFPLPVFVKGYACLTRHEAELASKDIDPARPSAGPGGRHTVNGATTRRDTPQQSTQEVAQQPAGRVLSYGPDTNRVTPPEKAANLSITA